MRYGDKIKQLRSIHEMTQDHLAEKLGVSTQSVKCWEWCEKYPRPSRMKEIANLFGTTVQIIFFDESDRLK